MEQLKKKLKTDEDLAWVDHSKTLDEQEIHEQDVVLLRRRFFYSDQNVDSRDPLQLGLLYVQTRDAILSGTHPVTVDGACKFAGIQCQSQLGDFMEGKTTRPGYINLKDYLPADYAKIKHIERKIFSEHKKYYGLSELEAKLKYVGEARSLPTYGVTFFLVKEKVPGKNKLVPRLLGITKDCVMRVDADTKAILKTWPLSTVKRWAPSNNSFTLDFGDYSDSYYSVQTSEGEQISHLIAGYIDIILKRRKAKDHFGIEGDEGATMIEDSVAPSRATIIQNQPALAARPPSAAPSVQDLSSVAGPQVEKLLHEEGPHVEPPEFRPAFEVRGKAEIGYESRPATQYVTNYELNLPQRDLQDRLEQAQDAVEAAQKVLDRQTGEVDRSRYEAREVEQKKKKLSSQFAEINAATAQIVSLSAIPEEELNYPALNNAVETVTTSLPTVAKDVKIVASLMEDEESGERLIDAARLLCKAFSDLLNAAEPGPTVPRQTLVTAATRVGEATSALLYTINDGDERDEDELLAMAKSTASYAAALILKAKDVASWCRDDQLQNHITGAATQCALATSRMVATARIVAATINDPQCQRKFFDAIREVQRSVDDIRLACQQAIRDDNVQCDVNDAVQRVKEGLEELTNHVRQTITRTTTTSITRTRANNQQQQPPRQHDYNNSTSTTTTVHKIVDESSGRPVASQEDLSNKSELMNQARNLARATTQLIQDIRPEAGGSGGSTLGRDSESHQHSAYDDNYHQQQQQQHHQTDYSEQQYRTREYAPRDQQQSSTTTTTITTTVYDEQQQQQQRRREQERERPISMYESESTSYHEEPTRQQQQQQHQQTLSSQQHEQYINETHINNEQQSQQQEQQQPAEATISGIVGDLETTIMFATAGTLRAQESGVGYFDHRDNVLRCAKALVDDTRPLCTGPQAFNGQSQLAQAAQESVFTMSRLAETVKASAASLGPNNSESQVSLIRSVKNVAVSLADLIGSTKSAMASNGGGDSNDPTRLIHKDSSKRMVNSLTSLLETVKSVDNEQLRGCRAIEASLEAIEQEIVNYDSQCSHGSENDPSMNGGLQVEDLIRSTRPVTMATAKTVHAGSSGQQDDAIVAANMSRKAVGDLLHATRIVSYVAESYELRSRVQEAGRQCALNLKQIIELLYRIFQHPSIASANPEIKQELINQSKIIATCVTDLVSCSELLKGTDWLDPNDPTVIAESELLGAASSIDAAAKKLENLKPRVTSVKVS